ncbi:RDD family protein [uncultured Tenacibaculum sp.]|uniref:RDD family protein n=1 Tax=uncultured Tenacibaculum sp. TaxID=174713 RepID=UPI002608D44F|nr:RDD family protein [uncultured Tenacibaculum sp.]
MKTLQVNTTQNVKINFELANVGQRLLAFIVDNIVKIAYLYFVGKFIDFDSLLRYIEQDHWSKVAIRVLLLLPITFYTLYSEVLMNGQTIGKKVVNIKVINQEGFKPSFLDYTIRWFMRMVDFNFFILIYVLLSNSLRGEQLFVWVYMIFLIGKMIGFFAIVFTKNNQRIGDFAANTVVVSLKDRASFSRTIIQNIREDYKPMFSNVIKLSDNDVRIIKDTFMRASKSKDYNTLIKLRTKIEEVTTISKPKNLTDIQFIDIVLKDFNYYTQDA